MQFYTQCFLRRKNKLNKEYNRFSTIDLLGELLSILQNVTFSGYLLEYHAWAQYRTFLYSVQWKKNLGNENTANLKFLCKFQKLHVRWFPAHVIRAHSQVGCIPRSQSLIFTNLTESREFMDVLFISSTTQRNSELIQFDHRQNVCQGIVSKKQHGKAKRGSVWHKTYLGRTTNF